MHGWENALEALTSVVDDAPAWMLVGSAATRLQGVDVEPGDVDVLVHPDTSDASLLALASRLAPFATPGQWSDDMDEFLSAPDRPLLATPDGSWLFGRWWIDGGKLEVARIRIDIPPSSVVETMGSGVCMTRRSVDWRGRDVPVVPLEVQLATVVLRGQIGREHAIRARLAEQGTDQTLLAQAFADRGIGQG